MRAAEVRHRQPDEARLPSARGMWAKVIATALLHWLSCLCKGGSQVETICLIQLTATVLILHKLLNLTMSLRA